MCTYPDPIETARFSKDLYIGLNSRALAVLRHLHTVLHGDEAVQSWLLCDANQLLLAALFWGCPGSAGR
jgi:hypothetical protein